MIDSVDIDYSFNRIEQGIDVLSLFAKASIYCEEIDDMIEVAHANGFIFKPGGEDDWQHALYHVDAVSDDVYYIASSLEENFKGDFIMDAFVLDHIETKESNRNQSIGKVFIEQMLVDLAFLNIELVGLTPGFYRDPTEEQQAWNKRLVKLYKRLGFKMVKQIGDSPVMAKLLN